MFERIELSKTLHNDRRRTNISVNHVIQILFQYHTFSVVWSKYILVKTKNSSSGSLESGQTTPFVYCLNSRGPFYLGPSLRNINNRRWTDDHKKQQAELTDWLFDRRRKQLCAVPSYMVGGSRPSWIYPALFGYMAGYGWLTKCTHWWKTVLSSATCCLHG